MCYVAGVGRELTREALLDATIDCLVDQGYSHFTTTRVSERAGVSRGAQVHHFPTKAELVAAAVEHLAVRRAAELMRAAGQLPAGGPDRVRRALDLLWRSQTGDLAAAALELRVAARTDAPLRARLLSTEDALLRDVHVLCRELFGPVGTAGGFDDALDAALHAMWGLALLSGLEDRPVARSWPALRDRLTDLFPHHHDVHLREDQP